jgi:hypothetical protein
MWSIGDHSIVDITHITYQQLQKLVERTVHMDNTKKIKLSLSL